MRQYQAEITATFTDPCMAARFVRQCQADGYDCRRAAATEVTVAVNSHRDERIVLSLTKEFKGTATVLSVHG